MPLDINDFLAMPEYESSYSGSDPAKPSTSKWSVLVNEDHPEGGGPFGGRDNALTALVGFLRAKRFPYEVALDYAIYWGGARCTPPLLAHEVHEKIGRKWAEWGMGNIEDLTPQQLTARGEEAERNLLSVDELLDIADGDNGLKWLVPNILIEQGVHYFSAPSGGAKSWVLMSLCQAIASGRPWLGKYDVEQGGVLYVDEEMGQSKASTRIKALGFQRGTPFWYLGKEGVNIVDGEDVGYLLQQIREKEIKLLILDTLAGVYPTMKDGAAEDARRLRQPFNMLTEAGATIVIAVHDRKSGADENGPSHSRIGGSRDLPAACDMAYGIDKVGDYYHIEVTKNRWLADDETVQIDFAIKDVGNGGVNLHLVDPRERLELQKESTKRKALELLSTIGPMNTGEIQKALGTGTTAVSAALNEMVQARQLTMEMGEHRAKIYKVE